VYGISLVLTTSLPTERYREVHHSLLKLQTALTLRSFRHLIYPVYTDLFYLLTQADHNISVSLTEYLQTSYPNSCYSDTLTPQTGAALLRNLIELDNLLTPYYQTPETQGLQQRHADAILAIHQLNIVLINELEQYFIPAQYSTLKRSYLTTHIDQLALEIDRKHYVKLWNNFALSIPQNKQSNPEFFAGLTKLSTFLKSYLTLEGQYPPTNRTSFGQLQASTARLRLPLVDTQRYFLRTLVTQKHTQEELSAENCSTVELITDAHQQRQPQFFGSLPSTKENHIRDESSLEETLNNNPKLRRNLAFVTALYNNCRHQPQLQLQLLQLTLTQEPSLRRKLRISEARELFNRELTIDYWLHDMLEAYCKLGFDGDISETLSDLTRFTLNLHTQNSSGIEKVYAVIDKLCQTQLLNRSTFDTLLPLLQMVPGFEHLTAEDDQPKLRQAWDDFRGSIPFNYLHTSYEPASYDIKQLHHFATFCADPELKQHCETLRPLWRDLNTQEKSTLRSTVIRQYFATVPFAMMDKYYPKGIPTNKLFRWSKLSDWYKATQENSFQATEPQHFYRPAPTTEHHTSRHREAFQHVLARKAALRAAERMTSA
jgi:hypothetical protein